jgi:S1-C subfamily serine protease
VDEQDANLTSGVHGLVRKYRWRLVAAAISVLLMSAAIGLFGIYGSGGRKTQSAYQELRREVETIKRKQNALLSVSVKSKKVETSTPALKTYMGTGVVIDRQGYLLTSHHVVADAKSIHVTNGSGEPWSARLVYTNAELDLAVLQVEDPGFKGFADMPFSILRAEADPGEKVYTLGYPREDMVFGEGSVSSRTGFEGDSASYQISIPVNPGNSGGPLFDNEGNLLGIISGRNTSVEGASFAVKSSRIAIDLQQAEGLKLDLPRKKSLRGLERTRQVKKIRDFVFVVHVTN